MYLIRHFWNTILFPGPAHSKIHKSSSDVAPLSKINIITVYKLRESLSRLQLKAFPISFDTVNGKNPAQLGVPEKILM